MKGNLKLIEILNNLLADELTAINQYMVHSEMCANWRYERLHDAVEKRAIQEMKHAEMHIARILFLGGSPTVSTLKTINIGTFVDKQLQSDYNSELEAVGAYNRAIKLAVEVDDNGTREMLENILKDEEDHLDWLEAQLEQIQHMGIQNYLVEQTD